MALVQLSTFPEELLECILAHVVVGSATPRTRPSWHQPAAAKDIRTRLAPLLVSQQFYRISLPLFYETAVLCTPSQSANFLRALETRPAAAGFVKTLVLPAPNAVDAEIVELLCQHGGLHVLDVTLLGDRGDASARTCPGVAESLGRISTLRKLTIRKASNTYLSQPGPRSTLDALAGVVETCRSLESVALAFPLSADAALSRLVEALAIAPEMHTLRTPMPAVWAPAMLSVAINPALKRIELESADAESAAHGSVSAVRRTCTATSPAAGDRCYATAVPAARRARGVLGTSLFLTAARQHHRLSELIRAGTVVLGWRGRAWTMGSVDPSTLQLQASSSAGGASAC
ncbi:unnamed protein product [Mycena citricolor]|uniref:Uncharacterized protein n=1 Tax=Mycena citricolor TaxID=2018698 RepID=A0AAD2Q0N9_9AGAR|nr:unnamed protein product [Mycena citricolor]